MGSCIGTCGPKEVEPPQDEHLHDQVHVQHKTDPIAPPSPSRSCSSLSSFSCNTSCSSSLSSTSSSASSSVLSSKDRTFSNEFLLTCIKDNPHIIRIKERGKPMSDVVARQRSFRKDPPPPDLRTSLRSPSPSRRFSGSGNYKVNSNSTKSLSLAKNYKENLMPPGPDCYRNKKYSMSSTSGRVAGHRSGLRNREAVPVNNNINGSRHNQASSSVGAGLGEVGDDDHDIPMEEIHNALISLDCFIFL